uniref:Uncharacterized protein n=1 Tax=Arion vulgaris TaxID=1028688 RepID=A0A0B6Y813_9EUPU
MMSLGACGTFFSVFAFLYDILRLNNELQTYLHIPGSAYLSSVFTCNAVCVCAKYYYCQWSSLKEAVRDNQTLWYLVGQQHTLPGLTSRCLSFF